MFILAIITAVLAITACIIAIAIPAKRSSAFGDAVSNKPVKRLVGGIGAILFVVTAVFILLSSFYSQTANEAIVKVSITGDVDGYTTTAGLHEKAPWDSTVSFDIKNQQIGFGTAAQKGAVAFFPANAVSVTDADGISSTIEMMVQFSIDPNKVVDLYKQYKSEDNFINNFVISQLNSDVRAVPTKMHTLELITGNVPISEAATAAAREEFASTGLRVEAVLVQNIKYPETIKNKYEQAAQSAIEVQKAQNDLAAAKVSAQQQIAIAKAQAEANKLLAKSLTSEVLQSRYIDALDDAAKNGNLIVAPNGSTLLNLSPSK